MKIRVINENLNTDYRREICELDYIPQKGDRLYMDDLGPNPEYVVNCVVHRPKRKEVLVFVERLESKYTRLVKQFG